MSEWPVVRKRILIILLLTISYGASLNHKTLHVKNCFLVNLYISLSSSEILSGLKAFSRTAFGNIADDTACHLCCVQSIPQRT